MGRLVYFRPVGGVCRTAMLTLDASAVFALNGQLRFDSCFKLLAFSANVTDISVVRDGLNFKNGPIFPVDRSSRQNGR